MKEKEEERLLTGNAELKDGITRLFHNYFGEVLDILATRFPHRKGDGSVNEMEFLSLRSRILRKGNDILREDLDSILADYEINKVYSSSLSKIQVGQEIRK